VRVNGVKPVTPTMTGNTKPQELRDVLEENKSKLKE